MEGRKLVDVRDEEFDELVDRFIERGEDAVTLPTFLQAMADVSEQGKQRDVGLTGSVVKAEVIFFDTPVPLPVAQNTLCIGRTKVVLKLRMIGELEREASELPELRRKQ